MVTARVTRKAEILKTLADMLSQPQAARITTAALAARIPVSEAALYRHFASKAQMFEGLIAEIEASLYSQMDDILASQDAGVGQVRRMVTTLLEFACSHRGKTRVLTGDALVTEDNRLVERVNQISARIRDSLTRAVRHGVADGSLPSATDPWLVAGVLTHFVAGKWVRFAQSGWQYSPQADLAAELDWLLARRHLNDGGRPDTPVRHLNDGGRPDSPGRA